MNTYPTVYSRLQAIEVITRNLKIAPLANILLMPKISRSP